MGEPDVADLIRRMEAREDSCDLLEAVAKVLGWQERKRTGLGLNGRTPGRHGWVSPESPWAWRPTLPRLLGPKNRAKTLAQLQHPTKETP